MMLTVPTISYQAAPNWELHFVAFDSLSGVMLPVDISPAQSWQAAVDTDFDSSTTPMIRTLPSGIITTGAASGVLVVSLDAGTTTFFSKVDKKNSVPAFFEVRGRDGNDRVLYDYRFRINALGAIDPQGGEPIPVESGGVTAADVYAIVQGNPQTLQNTADIDTLSTVVDGKQDLITAESMLDYGLVSGAPEIPTDIQPKITTSSMLDYSLISGAPTIPTVGSGVLTFTQNGSVLGSFNANATSSFTIDIPSGGGGSGSDVTSAWVNGQIQAHNESASSHSSLFNAKQDIINNSHKLNYSYLSGTPTIPTVNNPTITLKQGDTVKGTFTLNQSSNTTITFDEGGGPAGSGYTVSNAGSYYNGDYEASNRTLNGAPVYVCGSNSLWLYTWYSAGDDAYIYDWVIAPSSQETAGGSIDDPVSKGFTYYGVVASQTGTPLDVSQWYDEFGDMALVSVTKYPADGEKEIINGYPPAEPEAGKLYISDIGLARYYHTTSEYSSWGVGEHSLPVVDGSGGLEFYNLPLVYATSFNKQLLFRNDAAEPHGTWLNAESQGNIQHPRCCI